MQNMDIVASAAGVYILALVMNIDAIEEYTMLNSIGCYPRRISVTSHLRNCTREVWMEYVDQTFPSPLTWRKVLFQGPGFSTGV